MSMPNKPQIKTKKEILENELVLFSSNNLQEADAITTSLHIADAFGKEHNHVLRDIREIKTSLMNPILDSVQNPYVFSECEYRDNSGKKNKMIMLNRDSAMLICMGFTGEKALALKTAFIVRFNEMEQELLALQNVRVVGVFDRNELTEVIENRVNNDDFYFANKHAVITNKIYKALFNKTAKQLRVQFKCANSYKKLRDFLPKEMLAKIDKVGKELCVLLKHFPIDEAISKAVSTNFSR